MAKPIIATVQVDLAKTRKLSEAIMKVATDAEANSLEFTSAIHMALFDYAHNLGHDEGHECVIKALREADIMEITNVKLHPDSGGGTKH